MAHDHRKKTSADTLLYVSQKEKKEVYAFGMMPNHIRSIWKLKSLNGKKLSHLSFLKFTSHNFKTELIIEIEKLPEFYVSEANKALNFWQRDSLAIELYTRHVAY